jgi:hypothetical protein
MTTTFVELLPETKSTKHNSIEWVPGETTGTGKLTIHTGRRSDEYYVIEFSNQFDGRSFHVVKITEGSDKSELAYDVFCRRGEQRSCSCKGFTHHGHCRHHDAISALLDNEFMWARRDLVNGEQDVRSTEINDRFESMTV